MEEHRLPQQRGFLASTRPPPLNLLGQAQQGRDPGGTRTSGPRAFLAPTRPPPLTLLGQAQQGRHPGGAPPPKKRQSVDQWETKRLSVDRFGGSRHPGRTGTRKNDKVLPG
ncbi:hypothetical protein ROHU_007153 [Labeo rohita]|uniref:Uncharacterized protein n=1 Tax=Labeo rohita TaxID=84645 RepID=A0A498MFF2_LABRO|nr:hypothetical protein ROHU_007153 [Labeo rohita]